MKKDKKLREIGIEEIRPIEENIRNIITREVCKKIYNQFLEYKIDYYEIYHIISTTQMKLAKIKEGLSSVNYYNQTETIYFSDEKDLMEIEQYTIHEFIHRIQDYRNKKKKSNRMGLSTFYETKIEGVALNEAGIQYITSLALGTKREEVEIYNNYITTISPTYYPILTNLVEQMVFTTGEEVLVESIFNNKNTFENKFISLCGEDNFYKIQKQFDDLLDLKNKILEDKTQNIYQIQEQIKNVYGEIQNNIYTNYFDIFIKRINKTEEINECRNKLYKYKKLVGTTKEIKEFDIFCLREQFKLEDKERSLSNKLIVLNNNLIARLFRRIRNFLLQY